MTAHTIEQAFDVRYEVPCVYELCDGSGELSEGECLCEKERRLQEAGEAARDNERDDE